ncbi:hypothetical protein [Cellulomonas sp. Marseille-Q8402]
MSREAEADRPAIGGGVARAPLPHEFERDLHPSVRAAAARAKVVVDRKRGVETPQWIVDLAGTYRRF